MRDIRARMLSGEPYDPSDAALVAARHRARRLCRRLGHLPPEARAEQQAILAELFGAETDAEVVPPFFCDYGSHIRLGTSVFFNTGCVVLDVAPVTIGDGVLFGPLVQLCTATHPLDAAERASGLEWGRPIHIGDDVWVAAGAIIGPGVTVGAETVIGAGSVVVRDLPSGVLAAGNPCRVIRPLNESR